MVDLIKVNGRLPDAITVDGNLFLINTDFNFFINFCSMIEKEHQENEYDFMYKNEIPNDRKKGYKALCDFAFPSKELPRAGFSGNNNAVVLDYKLDEDLIYSAFYEVYKIDLKDPNLHLHWYKFQSLLTGLHDTMLNKVIEYRSYVPLQSDSREYRKFMLSKKATWEIKKSYSKEIQDEIDAFDRQLKC